MRRKVTLAAVAAAVLVAVPLTAWAGPPLLGAPQSIETMGTGSNATGAGADATPNVSVNAACAVLTTTTASSGWAKSTVKILSCTINGVPAGWSGTFAKTDLQFYSRNDQAYLTASTGTGLSQADTSSLCSYYGSGTWRGRAWANALVAGIPVSGGPWYNYTTC